MKILLVEDDRMLGDGLRAGLRQAGFAVDWVQDGEAALHELFSGSYEAVVLDLGLPRLDGVEVLKRTRAAQLMLPVLVLTARDAVSDRIQGLDHGADDYVLKPVDLHELAARLRALIRRAHHRPEPLMHYRDVTLDPAARTVTQAGTKVELAPREFDLLHALMLNAGRVLTRAQLEEKLYAWGQEVESNTVEVHVHHLRRKLGAGFIETVRGVGYLCPKQPTQAEAPATAASPSPAAAR